MCVNCGGGMLEEIEDGMTKINKLTNFQHGISNFRDFKTRSMGFFDWWMVLRSPSKCIL